ncbi:MAG: hypothetical protein PWQ57_3292 [Desulfovibrionales bacterium]|nr:hypothetical protein [Desulfovibrionales bacterium]
MSQGVIQPELQIIGRQNFTLYGKFHRANVLDKQATREALGIVTAETRAGYNIVIDESAEGGWRYEATQTVDDLRETLVAQVKSRAYALLALTDWYVTRQAETAEAVPAEVTAARAAIRTASNTNEAALAAIADYDEMLIWSAIWPE